MIVRHERTSDRAAVHALVEAAFGRRDEADLVDRLREDGSVVLSLVAVDDNFIVGHVLLTRMEAPFTAVGLAPLAVRPDRQRAGIGTQLVGVALDRVRAAGWQAVFVLGDPGYYRRFGFDPALARGFSSPYAGPHLMVLALTGTLPVGAGAIAYARPFSSLN